jgi:hypothetical protein
MNRKNQERGALIERTREAGSEQELEAAEKDAEGWLKVNPDDVRAIAASGRLAKTSARVQDPERGANRLSLPVFVDGAGSRRVSGYFYAALAAGVLIALSLTECVWDSLHDRCGDAAGRDVER